MGLVFFRSQQYSGGPTFRGSRQLATVREPCQAASRTFIPGCWPPPHWPCSGDNGIGAFHWMPLAPNQYYRKSGVSSGASLTGSDSVHFVDDDKSQRGLPEVAESTWWFKSFFQSEQAEKTSLLVGTNNNYLLQYKESQLLGEMADPRTA
ncbi:pancreatic progenitor cell differentiation and proliferation factor-like protein [Sagmatias obliquidens]|uniref:pancreatic progenitor cell differentiation and proliferation factor-like protein n=1 Tax=Sagmatias obliquidens TaxID=3371155 RepID=UPI000F4402FA|nr:pancreatic progenitor cell differentiation and proliferation factor-like protein [Lagenorhynchus obliquidens]